MGEAMGMGETPDTDVGGGLSTLMQMGFTEEMSRGALAAANGNLDQAIGILTEEQGATDETVRGIIEMGFTEQAARETLARTGGNASEAVALLLASAHGDGKL